MSAARQADRLLVVIIALLVACSGPTSPDDKQKTTTPTDTGGQKGGTVSLTSFVAVPATIALAEPFTLKWEGSGGQVSLARKGEGPFALGLAASGSLLVEPGSAGYPRSVGSTVYEAAIGDVAVRKEVTLQVAAVATPKIRLAARRASCYPRKAADAGCDIDVVVVEAAAYESLTWAGCCAGSTGSDKASCHVPRPGDYVCRANVTGPGGSASAAAQIKGENVPPTVTEFAVVSPTPPVPCNSGVEFRFSIWDEEGIASCPLVKALPDDVCSPDSRCPWITYSSCPMSDNPLAVKAVLITWDPYRGPGQNSVRLIVRDPWGADSPAYTGSVSVKACTR